MAKARLLKNTPFQNEIVASVAILYSFIILIGTLILWFTLSYWGFIIAGLDIVTATFGFRRITAKPPHVGVLTYMGDIYTYDEGDEENLTVSVTGSVFGIPGILDFMQFDMTKKEWTVEKQIVTVEWVKNSKDEYVQAVLTGKISMVVRPDPEDMYDYNRSGGDLEKIKVLLDDIAHRELQLIVFESFEPGTEGTPQEKKGLSALTLAQKPSFINKLLMEKFNGKEIVENGVRVRCKGIIEEKDFGVILDKINVDFPMPEEVQKSMERVLKASYDNTARTEEFAGDIRAFEQFKNALGISKPEGTVLTEQEAKIAWEAYRQSRLISDGKATEYIVSGNGITLVNPHLHNLGDRQQNPPQQGGRGRRGRR